jgi:hypothetical protein
MASPRQKLQAFQQLEVTGNLLNMPRVIQKMTSGTLPTARIPGSCYSVNFTTIFPKSSCVTEPEMDKQKYKVSGYYP